MFEAYLVSSGLVNDSAFDKWPTPYLCHDIIPNKYNHICVKYQYATASRYRMVGNMVWADFYFFRSFKMWRKIYAFGRFRRSPLKIPRGANILRKAYQWYCRRPVWVENKISNQNWSNICKDLAWIFGKGSRPLL